MRGRRRRRRRGTMRRGSEGGRHGGVNGEGDQGLNQHKCFADTESRGPQSRGSILLKVRLIFLHAKGGAHKMKKQEYHDTGDELATGCFLF